MCKPSPPNGGKSGKMMKNNIWEKMFNVCHPVVQYLFRLSGSSMQGDYENF